MDFEQIVNTGDAEDIFLALDGLSEQEQIALIEQLSPEAAFRLWDILNSTANWADTSAMDAELNGDTTEAVTDYKDISDEAHKLLKVAAKTDAAKAGSDFPRSKTLGFDFNGSWIDNPQYEETGRFTFDTIQDAIDYYGKDHADVIKQMYTELGIPDSKDVNGDGDTDVVTADTNGNGEKDTAVVTADSEPEKKEAVKAAKEDLGLDKEDKTSTGKTKGELEDDKKSAKEIRDERTKSYGPMREYHDMDDKDVVSDEKKKDMTCSDATQKNIMAALLDHRF